MISQNELENVAMICSVGPTEAMKMDENDDNQVLIKLFDSFGNDH